MPPMRVNDLPEMVVMPPTGTAPGRGEKEKDKTAETPSGELPEPVPADKPVPAAVAPARPDHPVLHTRDQLLNALTEPGAQGRQVRVAADANWELSAATVRANGSWRIQEEAGGTRPRIRFLPAPGDQRGNNACASMIELRSGSLQLEGFDIILPRENAPRQGRWAAFAVWPATDLSLSNCTVTIEGDQVVSAVVSVEGVDNAADEGMNAAESSASTVRLSDSLIRVGGDLIDVAAGRRLVLEMDNAVVSTGGGLVHAHGMPRGQAADRLNLTLRQVTARMAGGLIHLDSAPGEPELPLADINARYTILATTSKDVPLVRVDGQDAPESMRDRIVWEGQGVAYHQVTTYRRDQSAQVGAVPTNYNRSGLDRGRSALANSCRSTATSSSAANWPTDRPPGPSNATMPALARTAPPAPRVPTWTAFPTPRRSSPERSAGQEFAKAIDGVARLAGLARRSRTVSSLRT